MSPTPTTSTSTSKTTATATTTRDNRRAARIAAAAILALALPHLHGCGGNPADSVKLVPVSGVVQMNGKPLANATILFTPDAKNAAQSPGADVTGPDGSFTAKYRNRPGLAVGNYKVVLGSTTLPGANSNVPEELRDDPYMASLAGTPDPARKSDAIPEIYADPEKTPWTLEVGPSGETGLLFEVKAAASGS